MSTAAASQQSAEDPKAFYDGLVKALEKQRDHLSEAEPVSYTHLTLPTILRV